MREEKKPQVDVDELIHKIRKDVAKHHGGFQQSSTTSYKPEKSSGLTNFNQIFKEIETLLKNAELRGSLRTKWPDNLNRFPFNVSKRLQKIILAILNFLFKDQREVNFNLNRALKESMWLNRELIEQITSLRVQMNEYQSAVNAHLLGIDEGFNLVNTRLQGTDERLSAISNNIPTINEKLLETDTSMNRWIRDTQDRFNAVDSQTQLINERLSSADTRLQGMDERLSSADTCLQEMDERLSSADTRLQGMDERHLKNDSYLKNDLVQQKRLITMFLEEARRGLSEPFHQEQLQEFLNEEQHLLDAFYVAFEDQFRGSREDIFNRIKVYLLVIKEAQVGTPNAPILDVGCGRGEWLELLRESGYTARGIDINRAMVEQCKARKLEVMESDVIAYLQSLPDASLGAVSGFHIIEHLQFPVLMKLLDETVRVLKPDGLVIFETPNPRHLLVGAGDFYRDPTHRKPIHPDTIKFIAESKGFVRSDSYFFEQKEGCFLLSKSSQARFDNLNDYINISRDYAMIAYKP